MTDGLRTLLIVDDEEDIRGVLKDILLGQQIPFLEAKSGNEALKIVRENNITAILSDINMPDGNGEDFLMKIRLEGRHTPIVFLTANENRETMHLALQLGVFDFIPKPFSMKHVIDVAYRALDFGTEIEKLLTENEEGKSASKLLTKMNAYRIMNYKNRAS